jgi:hypothetical protein
MWTSDHRHEGFLVTRIDINNKRGRRRNKLFSAAAELAEEGIAS